MQVYVIYYLFMCAHSCVILKDNMCKFYLSQFYYIIKPKPMQAFDIIQSDTSYNWSISQSNKQNKQLRRVVYFTYSPPSFGTVELVSGLTAPCPANCLRIIVVSRCCSNICA